MKRLIKKAELLEVYHGTSSNVVDSIKSEGIQVVVGGDGDGAYVSTDWEDAKGYAIKRAGDIIRYLSDQPEYADVYPVMVVVSIDDSELTKGFNTNMFATEGISPDKIIDVVDLSNEEPFQALIKALELEKQGINNDETKQLYQQYLTYTSKYL